MSPSPFRLLTTRRMRMALLLEALKHTHMHTLKPQHSSTLPPVARWGNGTVKEMTDVSIILQKMVMAMHSI